MSDADQNATFDPESPLPPPRPHHDEAATPSYAAAPPTRFVDRVLGMRAVLAVALAGVVIGGLGGVVLGATTNGSDGGSRGGPGGFPGGQRGGFLHQAPQQPFGQAPPGT